jgi:ABC-2 type transport system permease protein
MTKFFAVVKREYIQRVRAKMFVLMTILAPLLMAFFTIVPGLIFSLQVGEPVKIAIVDETGKIYQRLNDALLEEKSEDDSPDIADLQNSNLEDRAKQSGSKTQTGVALHEVKLNGRSLAEVEAELNELVNSKTIDGYLLLSADVLKSGVATFYFRNTGDVFTRRKLENALSRAVRNERLKEANIDTKTIEDLSQPVEIQTMKVGGPSGEKDSGEGFVVVFAAGFVMYLTILLYGQVVLGAVIEEKETRIAEVLFSSVKPFTLMLGKLVGVSLVA